RGRSGLGHLPLRLVRREDLCGLVVAEPRERRHDLLQERRVALEDLELFLAAVESAADDVREELLRELEQARELEERDLRLDHPELGEVAARLRFLGTERRPEAVDPSEGHARRLEVELSRLREIGLLVEVRGLEQRGGPLAGVRREDRRVDEDEVAIV